jgi:hypothetical protein
LQAFGMVGGVAGFIQFIDFSFFANWKYSRDKT